MNTIYPIPSIVNNNNLKRTLLTDVRQLISDAVLYFEKESKEKYEIKKHLIKEATDMSTQEKLDVLDKNYECHKQEILQNILAFSVTSIATISFIVNSPITARKVIN